MLNAVVSGIRSISSEQHRNLNLRAASAFSYGLFCMYYQCWMPSRYACSSIQLRHRSGVHLPFLPSRCGRLVRQHASSRLQHVIASIMRPRIDFDAGWRGLGDHAHPSTPRNRLRLCQLNINIDRRRRSGWGYHQRVKLCGFVCIAGGRSSVPGAPGRLQIPFGVALAIQ